MKKKVIPKTYYGQKPVTALVGLDFSIIGSCFAPLNEN